MDQFSSYVLLTHISRLESYPCNYTYKPPPCWRERQLLKALEDAEYNFLPHDVLSEFCSHILEHYRPFDSFDEAFYSMLLCWPKCGLSEFELSTRTRLERAKEMTLKFEELLQKPHVLSFEVESYVQSLVESMCTLLSNPLNATEYYAASQSSWPSHASALKLLEENGRLIRRSPPKPRRQGGCSWVIKGRLFRSSVRAYPDTGSSYNLLSGTFVQQQRLLG